MIKGNSGGAIFYLLVISFIYSTWSYGQADWKEKVDIALLVQANEQEKVEMLVYFYDQSDFSQTIKNYWTKDQKAIFVFNQLRRTSLKDQASIIRILEKRSIPYSSFFIVNVIKTEGDMNLIKFLAARKEVKYVLGNPSIMLDIDAQERANNSLRVDQWGIGMINADKVWEMGIKGEGVVLGGQDTGYEWDHPAIKKKYRGYISESQVDHNYNWHDAIHYLNPLHGDVDPVPTVNPCGLDSSEPCDDHNHGTHTMGTMVGSTEGFEIGVAPDAQWCGCRNMDRGYGSPLTYLECFEWFLAPTDLNNLNPDPEKAPHVITNSWSCPPMEGCSPATFEVLNQAVRNLKLAGTVVVVSAGNDGSDCSTIASPAAIYENSFTIGAIASNDSIARFSSRGPVISDGSGRTKPNVVAPGVKVLSSIRNGEYRAFSGTSMAGPHVSGVVALIINANPQLAGQVDVIEHILESTALPMTSMQDCGDISGTMVPNNTYGYGRIDALAAVEKAISLIVDLKDEDDSKVNVYPNPVSEVLNFGLEYLKGDVILEIFDIQGRKVYGQQWFNEYRDRTSIDVSGFMAGMYLFRIQSEDFTWQGKISKI